MTILDVVEASGGSVSVYRMRGGVFGDRWIATYQTGQVHVTGVGGTARQAHDDLLTKLAERDGGNE